MGQMGHTMDGHAPTRPANRAAPCLVVVDADAEAAKSAQALGLRTIFVQLPGAPAEDLAGDHASLYTVDFDAPEFCSFVQDVLAPLAPTDVVAATERGAEAAAGIRELLRLPEPSADLLRSLPPRALPPAEPPAPAASAPAEPAARPGALLISHHPYTFFRRAGRSLLPLAERDVHLVTRNGVWGGVRGLTRDPLAHVAVCDIDDDEQWQAICAWWLEHHGVRRVIAVHERSVVPAARLRTAFGLPGMQYETALRFRDKVVMKQAVAAAGAAKVPRFRALDSLADLDAVDWGSGRKVIKHRGELAARDVHVVAGRQQALEVAGRLDLAGSQYEIEDFVEGPIYHCDSVVRDGRIVFSSVGRYIADPAAYSPGGIFGTMLVTEGELAERIREMNARVLAALGMESGTTHHELFHTPDDELVFCEIAGRPPGGIIPPVIEWQYGFNIVEADIRLQAGLDPRLPDPAAPGPQGTCGFIAFYPGTPEGVTAADGGAGLPPGSPAAEPVVEHLHHLGAGDGQGGVRHSTDFLDSYVIRAPDTAALQERIEAVRREYRHR